MTREEERKALAKLSPTYPPEPYVNIERHLADVVNRAADKGPLVIVGEPKGYRVKGHAPATLGDDPRIMKVLSDAGVLGKNERLMEFIARIGLGTSQILQMSNTDIQNFVATASDHDRPPRPRAQKVFFSKELQQQRGVR